jgi:hypothetical protein
MDSGRAGAKRWRLRRLHGSWVKTPGVLCGARLTLLAGVAAAAIAVRPAPADDLKTSEARQDPRLEQRVTLAEPRVWIGELLEKLTARTGVSLSTTDGDGAGDVEVTVFVTDTRLRDLMSALWSLVSYRGAEWHWSRSGKPGAYRYQLMRPPPAATFAARVLQHSQQRFEAEVATLLAAVNAPPERAAAIAARDPAAAKVLGGERERAALKTFSEAFSPETQMSILRGQALLKVPVSSLSPQGRAWMQSVWQQANQSLPPDQWPHAPQFITAVAHPLPGNVAPVLVMEIDGIGGYGYAGGWLLQHELDADLDRLWMLPGDAANDPSAAQPLTEVSPPGPGEPALRPVERRLRDLARGAPLSLLARLRRRQSVQTESPPPPPPKTVAEVLKVLRDQPPYLRAKWRRGVLLLSYPGWIVAEEENVPWPMVRRLREAEKKEGWEPSVDDVAAASMLGEKPLRRLAEDFPYMNAASTWQGLFRIYHLFPQAAMQMTSPAGLPVVDLLPAFERVPDPAVLRLLENGEVAAVRIVTETRRPQNGEAVWSIRLDLTQTDGQIRSSSGYSYTLPRRRQSQGERSR